MKERVKQKATSGILFVWPNSETVLDTVDTLEHAVVGRRVAEGRVVKKSTIDRSLPTTHCGTITRSTNGTISSTHFMSTRAVTRAAARHAVFNTQELLEEILTHLPTKDQSTLERVCAHWRITAKASLERKREKFMKVVKNNNLLWHDKTSEVVRKQAPKDLTRFGAAWSARQTTIHTSKLNTILFSASTDSERQALADRCKMCETLTFLTPLNLASGYDSYNITNQMLVANPPPFNVEVEVVFAPISAITGKKIKASSAHARLRSAERHQVDNSQGVTWGDVLRELDTVLFVKNAKRPVGTRELVIGVEKCKIWMKGIVFPTDEEMVVLNAGGGLGKKKE